MKWQRFRRKVASLMAVTLICSNLQYPAMVNSFAATGGNYAATSSDAEEVENDLATDSDADQLQCICTNMCDEEHVNEKCPVCSEDYSDCKLAQDGELLDDLASPSNTLAVLGAMVGVTLDANGGHFEEEPFGRRWYIVETGQSLTVDIPVRDDGQIFVGWYTDAINGQMISAGDNITVYSDMTLYAHYDDRDTWILGKNGETLNLNIPFYHYSSMDEAGHGLYSDYVKDKTPIVYYRWWDSENSESRKIFLQEGIDYVVETNEYYPDDLQVFVEVRGIGKYSGTLEKSFQVLKTSIRGDIILNQEEYLYTGKEIKPDISVVDGDYTLIEGEDYEFTRMDTNIGTARATISGLVGFTGDRYVSYKIVGKEVPADKTAAFKEKGNLAVSVGVPYQPEFDINYEDLVASIEYDIYNEDIVTMNENGELVGIKTGNTGLTAKVHWVDGTYTSLYKTVYVYTEDIVAVTFDFGNGGTYKGDAVCTFRVPKGREARISSLMYGGIKIQEGYLMKGWYTAAEGGVFCAESDGSVIPEKDMTLYARYSDFWTVKYDANGGIAEAGERIEDVVKGESVYLLTYYFTKEGFVLEGWCETPDCTGTVYTGYYKPTDNVTLYAKWSTYYTITMNAGEGSFSNGEKESTKIVVSGKVISYLSAPYYAGGNFLGWYDETLKQRIEPSVYIPTADMTLYAKYTTGAHTVTLHSSGDDIRDYASGSYVSSLALKVHDGWSVDTRNFRASRSGYTVSWYIDENYITPYNMSAAVEKDLELYAKWTEEITLTWDADGGVNSSGGMAGTQTLTKGDSTSMIAVTKDGCRLEGWFTVDGKQVTAQTKLYENTTIKARWSEDGYRVTFNLNGGIADKDNENVQYWIVKPGEQCGESIYVKKNGAAFTGWVDSEGNAVDRVYDYVPTKDTTLTAQWTDNCVKVTFHAGGGRFYDIYSNGYVNESVEYTEKGKKLFTSNSFIVNSYDYEDVTATGWALTEGSKESIGDIYEYVFSEDTDLYPAWSNECYTMAFDCMSGYYSKTTHLHQYSVRVAAGQECTYPSDTNMTYPGYTFEGWYTNVDYTGEVYHVPFTPTANMRLYAKWSEGEKTRYDVTFDSMGGSAVSTQSVIEGKTVTEPTAPTKSGFKFAGWFKNESCTEAYDFTVAVLAPITLYAKWAESLDVESADIEVKGTYTYTGSEIIPEITVSLGGVVLEKDTDYTLTCANNINAGKEAQLTITGTGLYEGTQTKNFEILKAKMNQTLPAGSFTGTYGQTVADVTGDLGGWQWSDGTIVLKAVGELSVDVIYPASDDNHEQQTGTVTVIVAPASIETATLSITPKTQTYDGTEKTATVTVTLGSVTLVEKQDYTVTYKNNISAGEAEVIVTAQGSYTGTLNGSFTIEKADPSISLGNKIYEVTYGDHLSDITLDRGWAWQDATLSVGDATGTATKNFKANFTSYEGCDYASAEGVNLKVRVLPKSLDDSDVKVTIPEDQTEIVADGTEKKPPVTVMVGDVKVEPANGSNYSVEYADNIAIGNATVTVTGQGNYTGTVTLHFKLISDPYDITGATITLDEAAYPYTGEAIVPVETVTLLKLLTKDEHYSVTVEDNTEPGQGTLKVTGIEPYHGEKTVKFKITASTYELKAVYGMMLREVELPTGWSWKNGDQRVGDVDAKGHLFEALYQNELEDTFTVAVSPKSILDNTVEITVADANLVYDPEHTIEPAVTIKDNELDSTLEEGTDYTVTYSNNTGAGEASLEIKGTNNYNSNYSKKYTIEKAENPVEAGSDKVPKDQTEKMKLSVKEEPFFLFVTHAGDGEVSFTSSDSSVFTVEKKTNDLLQKEDGFLSVQSIGEAKLTIEIPATANYEAAKLEYTVEVLPVDISTATVTLAQDSYVYTGSQIQPVVTVAVDSIKLEKDKDYTMIYGENTMPGEKAGKVTITGKGDYTGNKVVSFDITKAANPAAAQIPTGIKVAYGEPVGNVMLSGGWKWKNPNKYPDKVGEASFEILMEATDIYQEHSAAMTAVVTARTLTSDMVALEYTTVEYDGVAKEPILTVKDGTFLQLSDLELTWENNVSVGTAKVTLKGINNYTGTITKTFEITRAVLKEENVQITGVYVYDGTQKKPEVTVTAGGTVLASPSDYKVSGYGANVNAGTGSVTIEGQGNYTGTVTRTFTIKKAESEVTAPENLTAVYGDTLGTVTLPEHYSWMTPDVKVGNVGANTFKVKYTSPDDNYEDAELDAVVTVGVRELAELDFALESTSYVYTGQEIEPAVNTELAANTDYTVTYRDHVNVGTAKAIIVGIGNCKGTITKTFEITKADVTITSEHGTTISKTVGSEVFDLLIHGAAIEDLSFSSSNEAVVTVDAKGLVTTVGEGIAEIRIAYAGNHNLNAAELTIQITVTAVQKPNPDKPTSGSGGSGGGSGGGSTTTSQSAAKQSYVPEGYVGETKVINGSRVPSYVAEGTWTKSETGTWSFANADGSPCKDQWAAVYDAATGFEWYHFDANGTMQTGWITDAEGATYYLDSVSGKMVTGWVVINGVYYYFNEASDGKRGRRFENEKTPDGYYVKPDGSRIEKTE
ncbi:MAG: InlB B-repeat-containing protein [Lachnospiraceae bacterium]|nr:InlB B-repeat-containing protein [Lachnospiraceae bacterium]